MQAVRRLFVIQSENVERISRGPGYLRTHGASVLLIIDRWPRLCMYYPASTTVVICTGTRSFKGIPNDGCQEHTDFLVSLSPLTNGVEGDVRASNLARILRIVRPYCV